MKHDQHKPIPGNSNNGDVPTADNGGEARNGRKAQMKNHRSENGETLDEFITGKDLYEG